MTQDEYLGLVIGSWVICPKEDWDMPFGWHDKMSYMVNKQLMVIGKLEDDKHGFGIALEHPENGEHFVFFYRHLEIVLIAKNPSAEKIASFVTNGYKYTQVNRINITLLKTITLNTDLAKFKKVITPGKNLMLNEEIFRTIKKECPRLIGVFLSNNILIKNREV